MSHDVRFQQLEPNANESPRYSWMLYCAKCGTVFDKGYWSVEQRREFGVHQGTNCPAAPQEDNEHE